jgi:predicted phage tail protein
MSDGLTINIKMMTREQKLQLICLNPEIALQWMEEIASNMRFENMQDKRQEVKEELVELLNDFVKLGIVPTEKALVKKFNQGLVFSALFKLKF